jgi:hypothetical protein
MDLGQKPVTDFKTLQIPPLDTEPAQLDTITHPNQEGMQDDKADPNYPQNIPEHILPAQHRPQHHRPDLIRAIGYTPPLRVDSLKISHTGEDDSYKSFNANYPRMAIPTTLLTTSITSTNL